METQRIRHNKHNAIRFFYGEDVVVSVMLGFWYDHNKIVVAAPAKAYGLVAITPGNVAFASEQPMYGYLMFKPRAIEIAVDSNVAIDFVMVSTYALQDWYKKFDPWVHLRTPHDNTR